MKFFSLVLIALCSLNSSAFATPIDRELETLLVQNPTLEGKYFCGFDVKLAETSSYICSTLGYNQSQLLERAHANTSGAPCWTVTNVGTNYYLSLENASYVFTKLKCSRVKVSPNSPTPQP